MLRECPHCYRNVLPMSDSRCPACQKNVLDTSGVNRNIAFVTLRESSILPNYCYLCDAPTTRFVRIKRSLVKPGESLLFRLFLAQLSLWLLLITGPRKFRGVALRLPQCSQCARLGKPEPQHVDLEQFEISFVVNHRWRDRLRSTTR
jgi:hypothetical protein